jgi:Tol biopolymer transport system component
MVLRMKYPRYIGRIIVTALFLLPILLQDACASIAYEQDGHVVLHGSEGWHGPLGGDPSFSPKGDYIAFIREGNLWSVRLRDILVKQITHDPPYRVARCFLPGRVSWHRSGRWIIYTRISRYRYIEETQSLAQVDSNANRDGGVDISAIWIADMKTGKSTELLVPMGNLRRLSANNALPFASVYEPIFSPDPLCQY